MEEFARLQEAKEQLLWRARWRAARTVTDSERLTPVALPTQQNFTVFYRADTGTGARFAPYSPQLVATYQNCVNDDKNIAYLLLMVNQDGTVSPGVGCVNK